MTALVNAALPYVMAVVAAYGGVAFLAGTYDRRPAKPPVELVR